MTTKPKPGRQPLKERTRRPEDALQYPLGHSVKLESLIRLHEGDASAGDIAKQIGESVKLVSNHLRDLFKAGCIELVGHRGRGNLRKKIYRAIIRPFVSDDEYREMSLEKRHDLIGVVLQWALAECLSSYRNHKMESDEDLCLLCDEPTVDSIGKTELHDLLLDAWGGRATDTRDTLVSVQEIEGRAANRMAESGEEGTTMVVVMFAFERGRSKAPPKSGSAVGKR